MLDSILFDPQNRLLGSASTDFSNYGGQADPAVSLRPAAQDDAPARSDAPGLTSGAMPPVGAAQSPTIGPEQPSDSADMPSGALNSFVHAAAPQPAPLAPASAPSPIAFEPSSQLISGAAQHVAHGAPIAEGAGSLTPTAPLLPVEQPGDGVVTTLAPSLEGAVEFVGDMASPILDATTHLLDATLGAVDDTLSDLAGTDPIGGVATLVSLVSVTDMFDLHPTETLVPAVAELGFGTLDTLVGDLLPEPLLGTDHHDDAGSALGDALDHTLGL